MLLLRSGRELPLGEGGRRGTKWPGEWKILVTDVGVEEWGGMRAEKVL